MSCTAAIQSQMVDCSHLPSIPTAVWMRGIWSKVGLLGVKKCGYLYFKKVRMFFYSYRMFLNSSRRSGTSDLPI